ncbi:MAG: chorismate-binding protein [Draconibacterium sp.]|nr:chorismate-binding protein [Draconibacterium sp.]
MKDQTKISVKSVSETISVCLKNNLTFAAYRLPNQTEQALIVQENRDAEELANMSKITSLKGFLVAPFLQSEKNRMFLIKPDLYFSGEVPDEQFAKICNLIHPSPEIKSFTRPYQVSKKEYLQQIESIMKVIKTGKIQKAVLSRIKLVTSVNEKFLPGIFLKLCELFPRAFVYVFKTENHFWMGATPEPFAFLKNNVFQTSSVAGTKENTEKFLGIENWGNKEKQEQHYVSEHIDKVLQSNHWENIEQLGPYVQQAGNLLHLRTDFISNASTSNGNVGNLLNNLHPTPAICGSPTKEALETINALEKHDREYYGGFLGPVGIHNPIMLFVNLRCMQITGSRLVLYSGGGITIDSNPEDEWHETEIKTGTLLSVIKNIS